MNIVLEGLIWIFMIIIVYQDFRSRQVGLWVLLALAILFPMFSILNVGFETFMWHSLVNVSFISLQMLAITLYFSFKEGKMINITNKYLGSGDIVMLFVLCLGFAPVNFIFFYLFGLIVIVAMSTISKMSLQSTNREIPLAGALSIVFITASILNVLIFKIDRLNDLHAMQLLNI